MVSPIDNPSEETSVEHLIQAWHRAGHAESWAWQSLAFIVGWEGELDQPLESEELGNSHPKRGHHPHETFVLGFKLHLRLGETVLTNWHVLVFQSQPSA